MDAVKELDALIDDLGRSADAAAAPTDAIDAEINAPPRRSDVKSLRDAAVMTQFRQELSDGLIRVDTVASVLRLIRDALPALLSPGA